MNAKTERRAPRELDTPTAGEQVRPTRSPAVARAAYLLSAVIAGLMVLASAAGLLVRDLYPDGEWAREAFGGGDVVTLVLVAPVLIVSLILSARGSTRANTVWIGMLGYTVYNYAYYVFGARFNDVFLLHIALFSTSIIALACTIASLEVPALGPRIGSLRAARWVGSFLVLVGIAQGALWAFLVVRFAVTGRLLNDIPVEGQHVVFALDLSLMVPTLIIAGILLYRKTALGFVLGPAASVFGAAYQLNLMLAGVFQANADVAGLKAFPPEGVLLTVGFVVASAVLLMHRRRPQVWAR
jgi:hypothetical protein